MKAEESPHQFLNASHPKHGEIDIPLIDRKNFSRHSPNSIYVSKQSRNLICFDRDKLHKAADKSFVLESERNSSLQRFCKLMDDHFDCMIPNGPLMLCWNILLMMVIAFHFYEIPIALFFTEQVYIDEFSSPFYTAINYLSISVLLIDMLVVRPNTAFYSKGQLITDRHRILLKYLRVRVFVDILAFVVLFVYVVSGSYASIYLKVLFYCKAHSLIKADRAVLAEVELIRLAHAFYQFVRVSFFVIFFEMWVAVFFFGIDYQLYNEKGFYYQNDLLWLTDTSSLGDLDVIQNFAWPNWLMYSFYYSIQTSSLTGYGDLTAKNPTSVFYTNGLIISITVLHALFITTVWDIINQMQQAGVYYAQNRSFLRRVLKDSNTSFQVENRVNEYFHKIWKYNLSQKSEINQHLSTQLKYQLQSMAFEYLLDDIPIFSHIKAILPSLWNTFKIQLFEHGVQTVKGIEDELIVAPGLNDEDCAIYCIKKGEALLSFQSLGAEQIESCEVLKNYVRFGWNQFFFLRKARYTLKSTSYTEFTKLKLSIFKSVLSQYPDIKRLYVQRINRMLLGNSKFALVPETSSVSKFEMTKISNSEKWRVLKSDKIDLRLPYYLEQRQLSAQSSTVQGRKETYRSLIKSNKRFGLKIYSQISLDRVARDNGINSENSDI